MFSIICFNACAHDLIEFPLIVSVCFHSLCTRESLSKLLDFIVVPPSPSDSPERTHK